MALTVLNIVWILTMLEDIILAIGIMETEYVCLDGLVTHAQ